GRRHSEVDRILVESRRGIDPRPARCDPHAPRNPGQLLPDPLRLPDVAARSGAGDRDDSREVERRERMSVMRVNRNALVLLPALLLAALLIASLLTAGCKRITDSTNARAAAGAPASAADSAPPDGPQNRAVETETVAPQAIAGGILATGKILVPED